MGRAFVAGAFLLGVAFAGCSGGDNAPTVTPDGGGMNDGGTMNDGAVNNDGSTPQCSSAAQCDDGVACTTDACNGGTCSNTPDNAACDDSNPCTTDTCDTTGGCMHANVADTTPCTVGANNGTCMSGQCNTGCNNATQCNDGVACTTDACNGGSCSNTPSNAACDDGNECTTDTCTSQGCNNANVANGTSCTGGSCQNGTCMAANKTVFRINSIELIDPHVIVDAAGGLACGDITNNDLSVAGGLVTIPALNPALMDSVTMDTNSDGLLDLSYALEVDDLQAVDNFMSPGYVVSSDCTDMTTCMPTAGATPTTANVTIHTTGGSCLTAQGVQSGMWPDGSTSMPNDPVVGTVGCFVSGKANFTLTADFQGQTINIPLTDAQIAGTGDADPPMHITNGLITGFLPETVADQQMISVMGFNVTLGMNLLPDNGSNGSCDARTHCTGPDARDIYNNTCGWWFTLNFTADIVTSATGY